MADETDPKPTDGTVADLRDHLATIDDPDHLDQIKADEEQGKNRTTALDAIEARKAEIGDASDAPANDDLAPAVEPIPTTERRADGDAAPKAGEPVTAVVEINRAGDMTDEQINQISGGGLDEGVTGPRREVAEQLKITRDMQADPEAEHPYKGFVGYGYGPGVDIG